eukprot:TRINITY_DN30586_c0_g5_i1.p1 TRINITY_DN30586_c0_g5~~TRINITY_DN30586_c0_g5_i1.p1  ORF type:complete len:1076 (+),score=215.36 TRINITY_DN30586_c0_g5_i1:59-3286(+)
MSTAGDVAPADPVAPAAEVAEVVEELPPPRGDIVEARSLLVAAAPSGLQDEESEKRFDLWQDLATDGAFPVPDASLWLQGILGCAEYFDISQLVKLALNFAREVNPDGADDAFEMEELRLLIIYVDKLLAVLLIFTDALEVTTRGLFIGVDALEAAAPQLEQAGFPPIDETDGFLTYLLQLKAEQQQQQGGEEDVAASGQADVAVSEGGEEAGPPAEPEAIKVPWLDIIEFFVRLQVPVKKGKSLMEPQQDVDGDGKVKGFFAAARVAFRPNAACLSLSNPPPYALLEVLQTANPDVRLVEKLCKVRRVDVGRQDINFGWSPLLFAAEKGSVPLMKALLEGRADPKDACRTKNTALHIIARNGHLEALEFILTKVGKKEGLKIDTKNDDGWTPLNRSAICGHTEIALRLLDAEADLNVADKQGRTPPMNAARLGNGALVREMLARGTDLGISDKEGLTVADHAQNHTEMRTAVLALERMNNDLVAAVQRNAVDVVRLALEQGAQANSKDEQGWCALAWASLNGSLEIVRLLAHHNADIETMIDSADYFGDGIGLDADGDQIVDTLNASVRAKGRLLAGARANDWTIVEEELNGGAGVNRKEDETLLTCLMLACINCNEAAVDMLVGRKASLQQVERGGWAAIHFAAQTGSVDLVAQLVAYQADLKAKTYNGDTCMHIAVRADDGGMMLLLASNKCSVNAENHEGVAPLQLAAMWGCSEALRVLVYSKANPEVKDEGGRTLLDLAVLHDQKSAILELMEIGEEIPPACDEELGADLLKQKKVTDPRLALLRKACVLRVELEKARDAENIDRQPIEKLLVAPPAEGEGKRSPLHLAAAAKRPELVDLLLEAGAPLDPGDEFDNTPLMVAAAAGDAYSVKLILERDPDMKLRNDENMTALDCASSPAVRKLLLSHSIEARVARQKRKAARSATAKSDDVAPSGGADRTKRKVWRLRLEGLSPAVQPWDLLDGIIEMLNTQCEEKPTPRKIVVAVDPLVNERNLGYAYIDYDVESESKAVYQNRRLVLSGRRVHFINEGARTEPKEELIPFGWNWRALKPPDPEPEPKAKAKGKAKARA